MRGQTDPRPQPGTKLAQTGHRRVTQDRSEVTQVTIEVTDNLRSASGAGHQAPSLSSPYRDPPAINFRRQATVEKLATRRNFATGNSNSRHFVAASSVTFAAPESRTMGITEARDSRDFEVPREMRHFAGKETINRGFVSPAVTTRIRDCPSSNNSNNATNIVNNITSNHPNVPTTAIKDNRWGFANQAISPPPAPILTRPPGPPRSTPQLHPSPPEFPRATWPACTSLPPLPRGPPVTSRHVTST